MLNKDGGKLDRIFAYTKEKGKNSLGKLYGSKNENHHIRGIGINNNLSINEIAEKNKEAEVLKEIKSICQKYNIDFSEVPQIIEQHFLNRIKIAKSEYEQHYREKLDILEQLYTEYETLECESKVLKKIFNADHGIFYAISIYIAMARKTEIESDEDSLDEICYIRDKLFSTLSLYGGYDGEKVDISKKTHVDSGFEQFLEYHKIKIDENSSVQKLKTATQTIESLCEDRRKAKMHLESAAHLLHKKLLKGCMDAIGRFLDLFDKANIKKYSQEEIKQYSMSLLKELEDSFYACGVKFVFPCGDEKSYFLNQSSPDKAAVYDYERDVLIQMGNTYTEEK